MTLVEDKEKSRSLTDPRACELMSGELGDVARDVIAKACAMGADAAEVAASIHHGLSVTVRKGEIETVETSRDRGFAITLYFGQCKGSASTGDLKPESIKASLETAAAIAKFTEADPYSGLAPADRMATQAYNLDLYHPWDISPQEAAELATVTEAAALNFDPLISNSEGASVSTNNGVAVYANSHGFVGQRSSSRHYIGCSVLAGTGASMQRDHHYDVSRIAANLANGTEIGAESARRAVARHGSRSVPTGQYPVIMVPDIARSLWGHILAAASGGNLYRGASFLLDSAGKRICPEHIQLSERPHEPQALRSAWFDGEGVATEGRELIDSGVLTGYLLSSYSARKLGLDSTANAGGAHNLIVKPGERDLDQLIASIGTGLMVTELMGQGVNITTGDYSRGASGFWIENGQIQHPVEGVTIAGKLPDILMSIEELGSDVDIRSGIRTPSVVLGRMMVAGA